jgi:hypothetical protein
LPFALRMHPVGHRGEENVSSTVARGTSTYIIHTRHCLNWSFSYQEEKPLHARESRMFRAVLWIRIQIRIRKDPDP